jgi:hypothetical protein
VNGEIRQKLMFEFIKENPGLGAMNIQNYMNVLHGMTYKESYSAFYCLKRKCKLAKKGKGFNTVYFAIID